MNRWNVWKINSEMAANCATAPCVSLKMVSGKPTSTTSPRKQSRRLRILYASPM